MKLKKKVLPDRLFRPACLAKFYSKIYRFDHNFAIKSSLKLCFVHSAHLIESDFSTLCTWLIYTLKMESVSKNTIFGLKMMLKSGLEKIFLKFLHAGVYKKEKCLGKNLISIL